MNPWVEVVLGFSAMCLLSDVVSACRDAYMAKQRRLEAEARQEKK